MILGFRMKLCSHEPVGGKSELAHLFGFLDKDPQKVNGAKLTLGKTISVLKISNETLLT